MDIKYGRKINRIRQALKDKVNDWLESIEDDELRKQLRKDVIVTGGALASMLMGDKVNDYDIYFRTKESAAAAARHYVREMANVLGESYSPEVREEKIENIKGEVESRIVIWMQSAGVAADGQSEYQYFEQIDDPDVALEFAESTLEDQAKKRPPYFPSFISMNAITLRNNVQLVTRFFGDPSEIHKNYDFIHATCWYDHAAGKIETPVEALQCMMSRTLVYQGSLYPIASIFRAKKFIERGWRITAGQLLKIMWQISEIDMKDFDVLREQLTGVDMAYMWQLIEALKNVEPEKINSTYIAAIIDRIFD